MDERTERMRISSGINIIQAGINPRVANNSWVLVDLVFRGLRIRRYGSLHRDVRCRSLSYRTPSDLIQSAATASETQVPRYPQNGGYEPKCGIGKAYRKSLQANKREQRISLY